jgi:hypothetical protein
MVLKLLDLPWVLFFFGAQVSTNEDVVICSNNRESTAPSLNVLSYLLISYLTGNLTEAINSFERIFFQQD